MLPVCRSNASHNSTERASHPCNGASARIFISAARLGPGPLPSAAAAMPCPPIPQLCGRSLRPLTSPVTCGRAFPNVTHETRPETEKCRRAAPKGTGASSLYSCLSSHYCSCTRFDFCINVQSSSRVCHKLLSLPRTKPRADKYFVLFNLRDIACSAGLIVAPSMLINRQRHAGRTEWLRVSLKRSGCRQLQ